MTIQSVGQNSKVMATASHVLLMPLNTKKAKAADMARNTAAAIGILIGFWSCRATYSLRVILAGTHVLRNPQFVWSIGMTASAALQHFTDAVRRLRIFTRPPKVLPLHHREVRWFASPNDRKNEPALLTKWWPCCQPRRTHQEGWES